MCYFKTYLRITCLYNSFTIEIITTNTRAMKKIRLVLFIALASSMAALANDHIPAAVQQRFAQLYPEIKAPFWEERHDGIVAIFQDEEGLKKAFFQEDGRWVETRIRMGRGQLPSGVNKFMMENYREAEISFCGKVYTESGNWYRIESELPDRIVLKTLTEGGVLIEESSIFFSLGNEPAPVLKAAPMELLPRKQIQMIKGK